MGNYIGFFELASWCWLRSRNIHLCVGTTWISMDETFPMLQERTRGSAAGDPVHNAAARWNKKEKRWSAVLYTQSTCMLCSATP